MSVILMVGALLAACAPSAPATDTALPTSTVTQAQEQPAQLPTSTAPAVAEGSYPPPAQAADYSPYPAAGEAAQPAPTALPESYPPVAAEETFLEPRFRIDPAGLVAGGTLVEGQAPPGIVVALLDVTYNGVLLGSGRTDENGRFSIPVSPELISGNRIGVTVGELEPGQTSVQMAEKYFPYRGEGFMNIPNVGILFDTAQVQP